MLKISEKDFQRTVIEYAHAKGYLVYHQVDMGFKDPETGRQSHSRRVGPGFPDLVIAGKGKLIFAELKSEKGVITENQKEWAKTLAEAGARWFVWRPSQWEEIEKVLT